MRNAECQNNSCLSQKSPFREFIENVLMLAVTAAFVYICLALPFGY